MDEDNVLANQGSKQGMYQMSDPIHGKQSWISGSNAIWYLDGAWLIGSLDNIGTVMCSLYAYDDYGGLDDNSNEWVYYSWDNGYYNNIDGWKWAGENEVSIDCTSKN